MSGHSRFAEEVTSGSPETEAIRVFGLAVIFTRMLYNVQIIQKYNTWNITHVSKIVLQLPAKLRGVIYYMDWKNDRSCLRSRMNEVDTLYIVWSSFPKNQGKYSTTNIGQITVHLFNFRACENIDMITV